MKRKSSFNLTQQSSVYFLFIFFTSNPLSLTNILLEASTFIHSEHQFKTLKEVLALVVQASMISEDQVEEIDAKVEIQMKRFEKNRNEITSWFGRVVPNTEHFEPKLDQQNQQIS